MVNWNEIEYVKKIINESKNKTNVLNKLGLKNFGGNYNTLTSYINIHNIDISHFEEKVSNKKITLITKFEDALVENSTYKSTNNLKKALYKNGLKERKCELCGQDENWKGKKLSLILDHKNGINNDNRLENLRIVCPNCNATLETHCRGSKAFDEKIKNEQKKYKRIKNKKCSSDDCNNLINNNNNICLTCLRNKQSKKPNDITFEILVNEIKEDGFRGCGKKYNVNENTIRNWYKNFIKFEGKENILNINIGDNIKRYNKNKRKIERPEYEILVKEIQELGFLKTGTKYNVSDNSIRKWVKYYIKYEEKENILNIKI